MLVEVALREQGVYVTYEEFKGRKPIVRGARSMPVSSRDFDNPYVRRDFTLQTSGSTGLATYVGQSLDHIADTAPHRLLMLSALGGPKRAFLMDLLDRSPDGEAFLRGYLEAMLAPAAAARQWRRA